MQFSSSAFAQGGKIPSKFTCDGEDRSPPLHIEGVPEKAACLVIIMDDPDVPTTVRPDRMWVHWVVFNIPPHIKDIAENTPPPGTLGAGTGRIGYQGPCPPDREHRYFFKLYALDTMLTLKGGATKEDVEKAMKGHIFAQAEYMGRYERIRR